MKKIAICKEGWPSNLSLSQNTRLYYLFRNELTVANGLLLRGVCIVIPPSMHVEVLDQIHAGHEGIKKCRERCKQTVWWPERANF